VHVFASLNHTLMISPQMTVWSGDCFEQLHCLM